MRAAARVPTAGRADDSVQRLIAVARERFETEVGGTDASFDAVAWDIAHLRDRSVSFTNRRIYFTQPGTTAQPLPLYFSRVVKCWLILERHSAKDMGTRLDAIRVLWEAILSRRGGDPGAFRWDSLGYEDLREAESVMRARWSENTTHKRTIAVTSFARFLAARGICREIYYKPQTPRVEDLHRHTIAGQQARRERLPTEAALEGLAGIYRLHATEPADRLRICAVAVLLVTGFRIGELLAMPLDCEVEEERGGKPRYGLRYYREKSRGGQKLLGVRWLTPAGAELARQAISEIRALTNDARRRALELERSPHRVTLPGIHWAARLDPHEVARLLGFAKAPKSIPRRRDGRSAFYRAFDVEAYLRTLRVARLWTVDRRDGTFQTLSQSLFIAFRNFFHPGRPACRLLVESVLIQQINDFLSGRLPGQSAFDRFDIREPDGSPCRVTSHQFRHWLNYIADKGGLPVELQTRWLGRDHPRDTEAYRHATVDERIEWVKEGIRAGAMSGVKAEAYFDLPRARRERFLDTEIQAVHATAFGLCLHDFAVTPCPDHLNCVRGCPDYLRTKAKGRYIAEAWIRHCEQTLEGIAQALAVDDTDPAPDGSLVRPFSAPRRKR
jgi:hypothetical protein